MNESDQDILKRHSIEEEWHDGQISVKFTGSNFYKMGALDAANQYAWELVGQLSGKTAIDFGCGRGEYSLELARRGATVYSFDISTEMVKATQKAALAHGFSGKITAEKMAGENLKYPDNFADLVFGHSVLHHTELKLSRDEIHRVLRPKGRAVFLEPLAHNPLISIFRKVTPSRRTPTEKPWLFSDVSFFSEPFCNVRHREFYFLALAAFMFSALGNERLFRGAMERLSRLDGKLFSIWPALRRYAWVTVIEVTK